MPDAPDFETIAAGMLTGDEDEDDDAFERTAARMYDEAARGVGTPFEKKRLAAIRERGLPLDPAVWERARKALVPPQAPTAAPAPPSPTGGRGFGGWGTMPQGAAVEEQARRLKAGVTGVGRGVARVGELLWGMTAADRAHMRADPKEEKGAASRETLKSAAELLYLTRLYESGRELGLSAERGARRPITIPGGFEPGAPTGLSLQPGPEPTPAQAHYRGAGAMPRIPTQFPQPQYETTGEFWWGFAGYAVGNAAARIAILKAVAALPKVHARVAEAQAKLAFKQARAGDPAALSDLLARIDKARAGTAATMRGDEFGRLVDSYRAARRPEMTAAAHPAGGRGMGEFPRGQPLPKAPPPGSEFARLLQRRPGGARLGGAPPTAIPRAPVTAPMRTDPMITAPLAAAGVERPPAGPMAPISPLPIRQELEVGAATRRMSEIEAIAKARPGKIPRPERTKLQNEYEALAEGVNKRVGALFAEPPPKPAPVWRSKLEGVVKSKVPGKVTPEQLKRTLAKAGVKQEEIEFSGIPELMEGRDKVTKQEILDTIEEQATRVDEVVMGELGPPGAVVEPTGQERFTPEFERWLQDERGMNINELPADDVEDAEWAFANRPSFAAVTRHSQYVFPGGENYRELAITVPQKADPKAAKEIGELTTRYAKLGQELAPLRFGLTGVTARNEPARHRQMLERSEQIAEERDEISHRLAALQDASREGTFKSGHYPNIPNVVVHMRFNERTDASGKRTLFVEEVQSDWHQKGREQGYATPELVAAQKKADDLYGQSRQASMERYGDLTMRYMAALDHVRELGGTVETVPNAPFKKTWPLLALKRMIRWAGEHGFDRIAWTTGAQQVDRWESALRQRVDTIDWTAPVAKGRRAGTRRLRARKGGEEIVTFWLDEKGIITESSRHSEEAVGKPVAELVGKSIGARVMAEPKGWATGDDLTIGGEFFKLVYDQWLPQAAKKLGKRHGAKVGTTEIPVERQRDWRAVRLVPAERPYPDELFMVRPEGEPGYEGATFRTHKDAVEYADGLNQAEEDIERVTVHSLEITPSMRDSAVHEGMELHAGINPFKTLEPVVRAFGRWLLKAHTLRREAPEIYEAFQGLFGRAEMDRDEIQAEILKHFGHLSKEDADFLRRQREKPKLHPTPKDRPDLRKAAVLRDAIYDWVQRGLLERKLISKWPDSRIKANERKIKVLDDEIAGLKQKPAKAKRQAQIDELEAENDFLANMVQYARHLVTRPDAEVRIGSFLGTPKGKRFLDAKPWQFLGRKAIDYEELDEWGFEYEHDERIVMANLLIHGQKSMATYDFHEELKRNYPEFVGPDKTAPPHWVKLSGNKQYKGLRVHPMIADAIMDFTEAPFELGAGEPVLRAYEKFNTMWKQVRFYKFTIMAVNNLEQMLAAVDLGGLVGLKTKGRWGVKPQLRVAQAWKDVWGKTQFYKEMQSRNLFVTPPDLPATEPLDRLRIALAQVAKERHWSFRLLQRATGVKDNEEALWSLVPWHNWFLLRANRKLTWWLDRVARMMTARAIYDRTGDIDLAAVRSRDFHAHYDLMRAGPARLARMGLLTPAYEIGMYGNLFPQLAKGALAGKDLPPPPPGGPEGPGAPGGPRDYGKGKYRMGAAEAWTNLSRVALVKAIKMAIAAYYGYGLVEGYFMTRRLKKSELEPDPGKLLPEEKERVLLLWGPFEKPTKDFTRFFRGYRRGGGGIRGALRGLNTMAKNKLAALPGFINALVTNRDWKGDAVVPPGVVESSEWTWHVGHYALRSLVPIIEEIELWREDENTTTGNLLRLAAISLYDRKPMQQAFESMMKTRVSTARQNAKRKSAENPELTAHYHSVAARNVAKFGRRLNETMSRHSAKLRDVETQAGVKKYLAAFTPQFAYPLQPRGGETLETLTQKELRMRVWELTGRMPQFRVSFVGGTPREVVESHDRFVDRKKDFEHSMYYNMAYLREMNPTREKIATALVQEGVSKHATKRQLDMRVNRLQVILGALREAEAARTNPKPLWTE